MAFFHDGDRKKPVDPHYALVSGFAMDAYAFYAICWCLCDEASLRHWFPTAFCAADRNDETWFMDYGQFLWHPGEVIDDYFDMKLTSFKPLLEMKARGEELPDLGIKKKVENPNQLLLNLWEPAVKMDTTDGADMQQAA